MTSLLSFLWGTCRRRPLRRRMVLPSVEVLEDRTVLSAMLGPHGVLHILGLEVGDSMRLASGANQGDVALFGVPGVQDGTVFSGVNAIRLDALAGDDLVKIEPLALLQNVQFPVGPRIDVGGGAGSDILDISVLVGAPGYARDIDIDAGEGDNHTSVHLGDGKAGQMPQAGSRVQVQYDSASGDDRFELTANAYLEHLLVQVNSGASDDVVFVSAKVPPPPPAADACKRAGFDFGVNLDAGDDTLNLFVDSTVHPTALQVDVEGGDGDDSLRGQLRRERQDIRERFGCLGDQIRASMRGGRDDDTIDVTTAMVEGEQSWNIDAGDGNNDTRFYIVSGGQTQHGRLRIDTSSDRGRDRVSVRYAGPLEAVFDLRADTGGGDDVVQIDIEPTAPPQCDPIPPPPSDNPNEPPSIPLPDGIYNVLLSTGAGADEVSVNASFDRYITMDPGTAPELPPRRRVLAPALNTAIDLGADADRLALDILSATEFLTMNTTVEGGTGADDVSVNASFPCDPEIVVWNANIDLGNGDDILRLNLFAAADIVNLNMSLQGGNGADRMSARFELNAKIEATLWIALEGGNGDDHLELGFYCSGTCDQLFALLDGGKGFDTGWATSNVLVKRIEQFTRLAQ